MNTVPASFWQSQPQSLLHTWEVLICRWNRKWELFFPSLFFLCTHNSCQIPLIKETQSYYRNKQFSRLHGSSELCFTCLMNRSDPRLTIKAYRKENTVVKCIWRYRKHSFVHCFLIARDHLLNKPQHESNSYCETRGCVLYETTWRFSVQLQV